MHPYLSIFRLRYKYTYASGCFSETIRYNDVCTLPRFGPRELLLPGNTWRTGLPEALQKWESSIFFVSAAHESRFVCGFSRYKITTGQIQLGERSDEFQTL